jgi:uncharacterized protein involved in type VI secretion and phage assembly
MQGDAMSPSHVHRPETKKRFFGKYRGVVIENLDPMQIGRIQAEIPDVLGGTPSTWALPCVPAAGSQAGCFIVPPIGSQVWMEFEQGDPDFPIWTGGFWALAGDTPAIALAPAPIPPGQNIVVQTTGQNTLVLSDAEPSPADGGGVILKAAGGATIIVNEAGVTISNGKGATIALLGPAVSINSGALTVTGTAVAVDGAPLNPV